VLEGQRAFLELVGEAGRGAVARGEGLSSLVVSHPQYGARALRPAPPELSRWVGPNYAELLRTSFEEARSGKPYGQYFDETRP
jgi:hypothetical protein